MDDKNQNSRETSLLDTEVKEDLKRSLSMGFEQDFGTSWIPLPQTELHYRVYREEGQLCVCVGKVQPDDTVKKSSADVTVDNRLEAIELELKKLAQQFG
ncbi:MAG: hypothetical protein AAFQ80_21330 [Cyanobacteria bacterium J06621_8]